MAAAPGVPPVPEGTTELGVDIIKIDRIRSAIDRWGDRFRKRVLTDREHAYVRMRPENFAGRWAAKEAVSKVLGLGVRGVGWRDIEIVRLPTGAPSVSLSGRALRRAEQLGMGRIAVSISHEADYAIAVAFGIRIAGGTFIFPPDIDERLDANERRILLRMQQLRTLDAQSHELAPGSSASSATSASSASSATSASADPGAEPSHGVGDPPDPEPCP